MKTQLAIVKVRIPRGVPLEVDDEGNRIITLAVAYRKNNHRGEEVSWLAVDSPYRAKVNIKYDQEEANAFDNSVSFR